MEVEFHGGWVGGGGGGGGGVQSHFRVNPNLGYVRLSCGWFGVLTIIQSYQLDHPSAG